MRIDRFQTWLAATLIVGSGCVIAVALYYARAEAIEAGHGLQSSIVNIVAEQTTRTVQAVDQKMQHVAGQLAQLDEASAIGQRSTDNVLRSHLVGLPFVRALWVLDDRGRIIADSDTGNLGVSLSDREYYRIYREQAGTGFFLGAPVKSRSVGTWLVSAAYPIRDKDGRLLGVLAAALEPAYFEKLWGAIELNLRGAIDLYRRDGILMASSTAGKPPGGLTTDPFLLAQLREPIEPAKTKRVPADTGGHLIIAKPLTSYPQLVVVAHQSLREVLGPWRKFTVLVLASWLAGCGLVVALYILQRKNWMQRSDAAEALGVSEQKFSAAFRASPDAILITRAKDGLFVEVSDSVARITGYERDDLIGQTSLALNIWCSPDDRERYVRALTTVGRVSNMETAFRIRSGEVRIGQMSGEIINVGGEPHILGIIRDITDTKQKEQLIWNQAHTDSLTRLPNRSMLVQKLQQTINDSMTGSAKAFTLLMIDLDQFKEVNDTLGHDKGDDLLAAVAGRIGNCVPGDATVARLGGDEFAILLPGMNATTQIDAILDCLIGEIRSPFMLGVNRVYISASIGVAQFPEAGTEMAELLRHADQAMYAAKKSGRNCYFHFHQGLQAAAHDRATLTNDLRSALENGQFEVHYQPIVELATGRMRKAEALLRWNHPVRGQVSPVEFIPLAESSGLILEIGDWVFEQVVKQVGRMSTLTGDDFEISINVSPVQFQSDRQMTSRWLDRLQASGVAPKLITVEITEGLLLDLSAEVNATLHGLRNAGIQIALDDFGTGYSSLAYLRKLNIDYLKIDRSFVRNVDGNAEDLLLCEAIVAMAHKLELKIVVEGIENTGQEQLMIGLDCEFGQGYLFSKPVPGQQLEAMCAAAASAVALLPAAGGDTTEQIRGTQDPGFPGIRT
jgi:diguanylate cyclase (GGDEF)-like protein/PAS domain S-box-containing protein